MSRGVGVCNLARIWVQGCHGGGEYGEGNYIGRASPRTVPRALPPVRGNQSSRLLMRDGNPAKFLTVAPTDIILVQALLFLGQISLLSGRDDMNGRQKKKKRPSPLSEAAFFAPSFDVFNIPTSTGICPCSETSTGICPCSENFSTRRCTP